ncbi:hypothetical protein NL676_016530 [Syzygium grande]|nr:hypothetical protein NL676_016530 [Syzygium grande]
MAEESLPVSCLPCSKMLATQPSSLQSTPYKDPSQGSPLRVHDERYLLSGSMLAFVSMKALSSALVAETSTLLWRSRKLKT